MLSALLSRGSIGDVPDAAATVADGSIVDVAASTNM